MSGKPVHGQLSVSQYPAFTSRQNFRFRVRMRSRAYFAAAFVAALFTVSTSAPTPRSNTTIPLQFITLEEHYDSSSVRPSEINPVYELLIDALGNSTTPALQSINGSRLDSMNKNGIRVQVRTFLDLTPVK